MFIKLIWNVGIVICVKFSLSCAASCNNGEVRHDTKCLFDYNKRELWCDDTNFSRIPAPQQVEAYADPATGTTLMFNVTCMEALVPGDFEPYPRLEVINLNGNMLKSIDFDSFKYCEKVQRLILSNNKIANISPKTFQRTLELQMLSLRHNRLTTISEGLFANLKMLTSLDLSDNVINYVSPEAFSDVVLLETLDLSGNSLKSLQWGHGTVFPSLRTLDLHRNHLQGFSGKDLRIFTKLKDLNLSHNNLSCISDPGQFKKRDFTSIQLQFNKLRHISPDIFHTMVTGGNQPSAQSVVSDNNVACDCATRDYWVFLLNPLAGNWARVLDVTCASPDTLRGLKLRKVEAHFFEQCDDNKREQSNCTSPLAATPLREPKKMGVVADRAVKAVPKEAEPTKDLIIDSPVFWVIVVCVAFGMVVVAFVVYCSIRRCKKRGKAYEHQESLTPSATTEHTTLRQNSQASTASNSTRSDSVFISSGETFPKIHPNRSTSGGEQTSNIYQDIGFADRMRYDSGCYSNPEEAASLTHSPTDPGISHSYRKIQVVPAMQPHRSFSGQGFYPVQQQPLVHPQHVFKPIHSDSIQGNVVYDINTGQHYVRLAQPGSLQSVPVEAGGTG